MRRRWVIRKGELVELDLDAALPPRRTPYVQSDIKDYRSVITGEVIASRSDHRDHLRRHGCVEVGNEMPRVSRQAVGPVRDDIARALEASAETHAEARAASEAGERAEL